MSRLKFEPTVRPGVLLAVYGEDRACIHCRIVNAKLIYSFEDTPPAALEATMASRSEHSLAVLAAGMLS